MPAEKILWSLAKGTQSAHAVLRRVEGVGLGLRFIWNGELAHSQVYRDPSELLRVAQEKRAGLEARGWIVQSPTS